MKRILLDQGLAPRAAELLRSEGWDASHVSEAGLSLAEDAEILEYARQGGMACVTLDHDFHSYLALTLAESPSVVFLRVRGSERSEAGGVSEGGVGCLWRRLGKGRRCRRTPWRSGFGGYR